MDLLDQEKKKLHHILQKNTNYIILILVFFYRRLSAKLLLKKIDLNDVNQINKYLKSLKSISFRRHKSLRNEEIGKKTSQIAANPQVRKFINKQQRLSCL